MLAVFYSHRSDALAVDMCLVHCIVVRIDVLLLAISVEIDGACESVYSTYVACHPVA